MKNLTLKNMAQACNGTLVLPEGMSSEELEHRETTSVVIDSRKVTKDGMFVAVKGERQDGHSFIPAVAQAGVLGVICEREPEGCEIPYILVEDSLTAFRRIAAFYREQLSIPVVGITGSVGKTSTKEFIASVLSQKFKVCKTQKNFNNEIGLPMTVLSIRPEDEAAVLEMGISDFGEMSRLTGDSVAYLQNHLIEAADEFARQYNVICVLKDEHTATAIPYSQTWLNVSGNAGLATAGSGDVLSGIIGGLMAQGIRVEQAAPLGVYLHGKAGEAAGARRSMRGMTASDIHDGMCEILAGLEQTQSQPGKDGIS